MLVAFRNHILAGLSENTRRRLAPSLETVTLGNGEVVHEPGVPIERVVFPEKSVISIIQIAEDGAAAEIGIVGYEGLSGLDGILRERPSSALALCQMPGEALVIPLKELRAVLRDDDALMSRTLDYVGGYCAMLAQLVACSRLHRVEQRCARWLLMMVDRIGRRDFAITQERLSMMLGAQRPTVTTTMAALRSAGCIHYSRGHVDVLDREKLESFACECYDFCTDCFRW